MGHSFTFKGTLGETTSSEVRRVELPLEFASDECENSVIAAEFPFRKNALDGTPNTATPVVFTPPFPVTQFLFIHVVNVATLELNIGGITQTIVVGRVDHPEGVLLLVGKFLLRSISIVSVALDGTIVKITLGGGLGVGNSLVEQPLIGTSIAVSNILDATLISEQG